MRKSLSILVLLLVILFVWLWMGNHAQKSPSEQSPAAFQEASSPNPSSPTLSFAPLHFPPTQNLPAASPVGSSQAPSPFRIISCVPEETILEFTLPDYTVTAMEDTEGVTWQRISIEGADTLDIAGKPSLPSFHLAYGAIPGSTLVIEVRDTETALLSDCRPLPARGPYLRTQEPPELIPAEETYAPEATIYPALNAYVASSYQIRGIQGKGIVFSPFQYDAETNSVQVVTRCEISLRSDDHTPATLSTQSDFAQLQLAQFVNSPSFRSEDVPTVGSLSILVPDAWTASEILAEFVSWKESVGWDVEVTAYPSETGEGRENILAWSQQRYAQGMTHLLLLGDYTAIPPWQHGSAMSSVDPEYSSVATDTPYALLAGEGDLSYMDVFMGRIPAGTQDYLENALQSSIFYEHGAYQDCSWTQNGLYIASSSQAKYWPYRYVSDTAVIQAQAKQLDDSGIILRDISTELYASKFPKAVDVSNALNAGTSLLLYLGHGSCTAFTTTSYASSNAKNLDNHGMLPFVMAPVCDTGNLDHACLSADCPICTKNLTYHSLGQTFFENPNYLGGVIGAALSSHLTYWNPPIRQIETLTTDLSNNQSTTRLVTQGAYELSSLNAAVDFCDTYEEDYEEAGSPAGKGSYNAETGILHAWEMALYGDPTAVLHVGPQVPLNIAYTLQADGSADIAITGFNAEAPHAVPNCAVCIQTTDGLISGRTNTEGVFTLQDGSQLLLGTTIRILDGSGPYLEKEIQISLDANADGKITNREMSAWLDSWNAAFDPENANAQQMLELRDNALAEWQEKPDTPEFADNDDTLDSPDSIDSPVFLDICEEMDSLCYDYWPHIRPTTIGASVNGTPISGVRISLAEENADVPNLLLLADVHGDEPQTLLIAQEILNTLVDGISGTDETVCQWLENCVVWVVPVFNPDGYANGTPDNANGVDLSDGFPENCGTLSSGDPTQLYVPWTYDSATQHFPEPEQTAFVRWMVAHSISSVLELRQGERYVTYAGEQSQSMAHSLADLAGYECDGTKAGSMLDWVANYLGCQALAISAADAEDDAFYDIVITWIVNADLSPVFPNVQRIYLPGHDKEISVDLTDAGKTPVIRVILPDGWHATANSDECVGMRQGDGYLDVAMTAEEEIACMTLSITADDNTNRETRLDFTLDTPDTQTSWNRVMVAPTYQTSTTIALNKGWNMLAVPLAGITPAMLGISDSYVWKDGRYLRSSLDSFQPAQGYWVKCDNANTSDVHGWWMDPEPLAVKKGNQLLGTVFPHAIREEETILKQKDNLYQIIPTQDGMPVNQAVWRYFPEDGVVVP